MNRNDAILTPVVAETFRSRGFIYIARRIEWYYNADYTMLRPLRDIYLRIFRLRGRPFLSFYQDVYLFRNVPHYEDAWAVVMFVTAALLTLLSPVLGVEYERWADRRQKKATMLRLTHALAEQRHLLAHLEVLYFLRDEYYRGVLPVDRFHGLRMTLEESYDTGDPACAIPVELQSAWGGFKERSAPPLYDIDAGAIADLAKQLRAPKQASPSPQIPAARSFQQGIAASPGSAIGRFRITNMDAVPLTQECRSDDIRCFVDGFDPGHIHLLESSRAAIGVRCGGMTGHLAVVCRGIGKPCVLLYDPPSLSLGALVGVDGSIGRVYTDLHIDDILNYYRGGVKI